MDIVEFTKVKCTIYFKCTFRHLSKWEVCKYVCIYDQAHEQNLLR